MDEILCSVCKRAMSPKEVGKQGVSTGPGEMICSECLREMSKHPPVRCEKCHAFMPPVGKGDQLVCRKCGAALSQEPTRDKNSGAKIETQKTCPYCGKSVRTTALRCTFCGSSLNIKQKDTAYLLRANRRMTIWVGALVTICIIVLAVIAALEVRRMYFVPIPSPAVQDAPEAPTEDTPVLATEESVLRLDARLEVVERNLDLQLASLKTEIAELREALAAAREKMDEPDSTGLTTSLSDETQPEADRATKIIREIAAEEPEEIQPPPPAPEPARPVDPQVRAERIFKATKRNAELQELEFNFRRGLRVWDTFPKEFDNTQWQEKVEQEKEQLIARATEAQNKKLADAEALRIAGDLDQAESICKMLLERGLPNIETEAKAKLLEIVQAIEEIKNQERLAAEEAARRSEIQKLILALNDKENKLRTEAAVKLGELKAETAVPDLTASLADPDWFLVLCSARSLVQIEAHEAFPAVISAMSNEFPAVPAGIADALKEYTGQDFGNDQAKWSAWWEDNKENFMPPTESQQ